MTLRGVVLKVLEELHRRDIEVSYDVARLVIELALEVIKNETSKGSPVSFPRFGTFKPRFRVVAIANWAGWVVRLNRHPDWTRKCRLQKGVIPMKEKYAYEQEQKNPKVKTASERGRCPECGAELRGNPPVCPNHGSKPFERREDDEGRS